MYSSSTVAEFSKIVQQVAGKLTVRCSIDYICTVIYIMETADRRQIAVLEN